MTTSLARRAGRKITRSALRATRRTARRSLRGRGGLPAFAIKIPMFLAAVGVILGLVENIAARF